MLPHIFRAAAGCFHAAIIFEPRKLDRSATIGTACFAFEGRYRSQQGIDPRQFFSVVHASFLSGVGFQRGGGVNRIVADRRDVCNRTKKQGRPKSPQFVRRLLTVGFVMDFAWPDPPYGMVVIIILELLSATMF
jgi:hypothetical protein